MSVVLPVYNRKSYLWDAITSVLRQSLDDLELLIVNDGSTNPEVMKIIERAEQSDCRVRVITQENRGVSGARNTGIANSSAPLVALMDDDDVSGEERLAAQHGYLSGHPECAAVTTALAHVDSSGKRIRALAEAGSVRRSDSDMSLMEAAKAAKELILNASTMFRKQSLLDVGGYRDWFECMEDIDMSLRLMEHSRVALLPEPLYLHRIHRGVRVSQHPASWEYYAAAVLSASCRRREARDLVEDGVDLSMVIGRLSELDGEVRSHLIWEARKVMRRQIRDNDRQGFVRIREKARSLTTGREESGMFASLMGRARKQAVRHLRYWAWREAR